MAKKSWSYDEQIRRPKTGSAATATVEASRSDGWHVITMWEPLRGRAEPVEMRVRPPEGQALSTDALQRLGLGGVIAEARKRLARAASLFAEIGFDIDDSLQRPGPHKGRKLGADELQEVAAVYREAWGIGRPVNEAVREAFGLTKDGAAKRIARARKAGLLDDVGPQR